MTDVRKRRPPEPLVRELGAAAAEIAATRASSIRSSERHAGAVLSLLFR
jgi:hypothetical protein